MVMVAGATRQGVGGANHGMLYRAIRWFLGGSVVGGVLMVNQSLAVSMCSGDIGQLRALHLTKHIQRYCRLAPNQR